MKIVEKIKTFFNGLAWGMRQADDIIMTQGDNSIDNGYGVHQQVTDSRVSKALLRGEVTQEVKELRYRTYKVDREAKNYEYFAPTLAKKYEGAKDDSKFVKYENSENLTVVTIQSNDPVIETVEDSMERIEGGENISKTKKRKEYTVSIERNFVPRYRLEEFTKRVVVKQCEDESVIIDFYVPKYANPFEDCEYGSFPKSKGFITEVERILNGGRYSDVFEFDRISFLTNHAYRLPDMIYFSLRTPIFKGITEFDGHYVIKFRCVVERKSDEVEQYYEPVMEEKYKNKVKKNLTLNFEELYETREYVCERCGKIMVYDPLLIEDIEATEGKEIDDVSEEDLNKPSVLEYLDAEIAQQTTGHVFCKDCLQKYLKEMEDIDNLR